jgi:hypothetical protein
MRRQKERKRSGRRKREKIRRKRGKVRRKVTYLFMVH